MLVAMPAYSMDVQNEVAELSYNLSDPLVEQSQPADMTLKKCNEAISRNKNDFRAYVQRGILFSRMGKDKQAARDFETATKLLDTKDPRAKVNSKVVTIRMRAKKEGKIGSGTNKGGLVSRIY